MTIWTEAQAFGCPSCSHLVKDQKEHEETQSFHTNSNVHAVNVGPSHALLLPMTSWTKKRNAACWSVMHGSNCLSVMLVLVRHDVQQHLIFLETLSMLTTQKKGNMNWEVTSSLLQLSERTTNHVGHQQKHHFWVSINHTAMQQPAENIPMTEQQTDANWRQVHPGGERKEMRKKQRWNHSPQSQDPKRTEMKQSFNEEDSRQKKLSKDGFQAAGVTKEAIYLIWQSMTKR